MTVQDELKQLAGLIERLGAAEDVSLETMQFGISATCKDARAYLADRFSKLSAGTTRQTEQQSEAQSNDNG